MSARAWRVTHTLEREGDMRAVRAREYQSLFRVQPIQGRDADVPICQAIFEFGIV